MFSDFKPRRTKLKNYDNYGKDAFEFILFADGHNAVDDAAAKDKSTGKQRWEAYAHQKCDKWWPAAIKTQNHVINYIHNKPTSKVWK